MERLYQKKNTEKKKEKINKKDPVLARHGDTHL
jgi:hypothetical protein